MWEKTRDIFWQENRPGKLEVNTCTNERLNVVNQRLNAHYLQLLTRSIEAIRQIFLQENRIGKLYVNICTDERLNVHFIQLLTRNRSRFLGTYLKKTFNVPPTFIEIVFHG